MTTALLRYDEACRAVAAAKTLPDVKDVHDKAEAMRVYARMADNVQLEQDATEIRLRAERRFGALELELKADGLLHKGGRPPKAETGHDGGPVLITLEDLGVTKNFSSRAQKTAGIAELAFEAMVARTRQAIVDNRGRVSLDLVKAERDAKRKAEHAERTYAGGKVDDLHALAASGFRAGAILADPAWNFIARSDKGEGRSASQHYDVQHLDAIKALPIGQLAADDCVLFMWMVGWCPSWALDVIEAWGFVHKTTAFTWAKLTEGHDGIPKFDGAISDRDFHFGQGYWTRANPEDCWLATRGSPKRMNADVRQLVVHPLMDHSRKPDVHDRIERLVGGPYLEINARRERPGWVTWGNELPFEMPKVDDAGAPLAFDSDGIVAEPAGPDDELDIPAFIKRRDDNISDITEKR